MPRFPVSDSYVSNFRRENAGTNQVDLLDRNPKTVKRLADKIRALDFDDLIAKVSPPIEASRQNGAKFRGWLNGVYSVETDEKRFLKSTESVVVFDGSDAKMNQLVKSHLCDDIPRKQENVDEEKGIDLLMRIITGRGEVIYVIAETKWLTQFGGAQNNQFNDALSFLKSPHFKPKKGINVQRCAILDGVCWMKWKDQKMQKGLKGLNENQPAFSALHLDEYIRELSS